MRHLLRGVLALACGLCATALALGQPSAVFARGLPNDLVGNSDFTQGTAGWTSHGSHVAGTGSVSLGREDASSGSSAVLVFAGSGTAQCTLNDAPNWVGTSSNQTYVADASVAAPRARTTIKIRFREYSLADKQLVGYLNRSYTIRPGWQHVTLSYRPKRPGATTIDFGIYAMSAAPGRCFSATAVTITGMPSPHATGHHHPRTGSGARLRKLRHPAR